MHNRKRRKTIGGHGDTGDFSLDNGENSFMISGKYSEVWHGWTGQRQQMAEREEDHQRHAAA
jgi:hypothetical protein